MNEVTFVNTFIIACLRASGNAVYTAYLFFVKGCRSLIWCGSMIRVVSSLASMVVSLALPGSREVMLHDL